MSSTSKPPSTAATASTPPAPSATDRVPTTDPVPTEPAGSRTRLLVVAVVVGLWFAALTTLALRTANPVTVNRAQLLSADAVVVATLDAVPVADGGASFRVRETLAGTGMPERIAVTGLGGNRLPPGAEYVLALRRSGTGYGVMPTPLGTPLVYPTTPETMTVVADVLRTADPRPYP